MEKVERLAVNNSEKGKRIIKNTLLLYIRMLFLMLVTLYTSRVVLDALGVVDYGIYNVVGGFVSMFALISAALTGACSRFINIELGKGTLESQKVVFSTSLTIQSGLALIVAVLSEVIGIWFINNVMVLPVERLSAAHWCFQFSVFTFCMNLITVPYNASIIAHEKMKAFAYLGVLQGVVQLFISFLICWNPFDRLVFYALLLMLLQFSIRYMFKVYCRRNFPECQYQFILDKPLLKRMFGYSLWHMIGNGGVILKGHGVNLLLNFFFGPAVNAARGIASQVDNTINLFVTNFMMSINPQITQSYAKGDFSYMHSLINKGSRFSFFLLLLLSLPVMLNIDFLLQLWLKEVPPYTSQFAQLTLISIMIESISKPLVTAQNATGNVRNYQLVVGGVQLLNLPLSFIALYMGMSPVSVVVVLIIVSILTLAARLYMLPFTLVNFSRMSFFNGVILKCFFVTIVASIFPMMFYGKFAPSILSFLISSIISILLSIIAVLYVGCNEHERFYILKKALGFLKVS